MLENFLPYLNKIYKTTNIPCYEIDFENLISPIKTIDLGLKKQELMVKEKFFAATEKFKNIFTFIYTDASKKDNRMGYGLTIPELKYKFSSRLNDLLSICKAEILAIHEAVKTIISKKIGKAIIFSDSKSAIQKINSNLFNAKTDYWSLRTKRLIVVPNKNGFDVRVAWIPGHADIPGNTEADALANIGRILTVPKKMELDSIDICNNIKINLKERFKQRWNYHIQNKKYRYNRVQNSFPNKKWFSLFPYKDRRHITTIIRMRTGHCLTNEFLYKINAKDSPRCECGSIENLNHIYFECPINTVAHLDLYKECIKLRFPPPITIYSILSQPCLESIKIIIHFLNLNKIKL